MAFEAAWDENGAACVARPRVADKVSLTQLAERHTHLAVGPAECNYEGAKRNPAALLFNWSYE